MGPCGVYCAACPSYDKTCNGCGSGDESQKRRSKWGCKTRVCCLDTKNLQFCNQCEDFPCKVYLKKLPDSPPRRQALYLQTRAFRQSGAPQGDRHRQMA
ncbi:DUF3795 domain-containing protein [Chloroflexota bacterium]